MNGRAADRWRDLPRRLASAGLGARLLAALVVVLAVVGVTAWLVAGVVGPYMFHKHLVGDGQRSAAEQAAHAEIAFRSASGVALSVALAAAIITALVVSIAIARRIGSSLSSLSAASRRVADGEVGTRVPSPRMGREFDDLVESFNLMASKLDASEGLRKRLLSDVAHELRTPVATIHASLEALEDGVADLDAETVAMLRAQSARLTRLAEDLAAVTRAESGEMNLSIQPCDPTLLLRAAHDAAREAAAERKVTLTLEADSTLPQVAADSDRMAQVLGNLVDNALRHTQAGGEISLKAGAARGMVELSVSDNGEGIAPEHLPHVFERFYRADTARDRAHGGSGIGLAITKALVEAHGGALRAESAGVGRGARFVVAIPVRGTRGGA
ncbi:MAG TPA: ATP-binding protein [Demequina sp.]|nr:ATP-binding protein [Demequina sp.]